MALPVDPHARRPPTRENEDRGWRRAVNSWRKWLFRRKLLALADVTRMTRMVSVCLHSLTQFYPFALKIRAVPWLMHRIQLRLVPVF
jgi:hypothetical protein